MKVVLMRGTSCSGKGTYLKNREGIYPKLSILSSDDFREFLFGDRTYQRGNDAVFGTMHKILESRLVHRTSVTVMDATHIRMSDCKEVLTLCKKYGAAVEVVSIVPPSLQTLIDRNNKRYAETGFYIPEHVFTTHTTRYETCKPEFLKTAENDPNFTFTEISYNEV